MYIHEIVPIVKIKLQVLAVCDTNVLYTADTCGASAWGKRESEREHRLTQ